MTTRKTAARPSIPSRDPSPRSGAGDSPEAQMGAEDESPKDARRSGGTAAAPHKPRKKRRG